MLEHFNISPLSQSDRPKFPSLYKGMDQLRRHAPGTWIEKMTNATLKKRVDIVSLEGGNGSQLFRK